jgi:hypothetical protein
VSLIGPLPALAQWQGGAAQGAAQTYCASRSFGKSHDQANNDVSKFLASSGTMVNVLMSGYQIVQTTYYLAKQQCPEYFSTGGTATPVKQLTSWQNYCADNLWLKECGGQNPDKVPGFGFSQIPPEGSIPAAKPLNPLPAQSQSVKPAMSTATKVSAQEAKAHNTCLKAVDYAGCMKYQLTK